MSPRVLIIGGGAIGSVLAARLVLQGHSVTVLDTNEEHVKRMRDPGLNVDLIDREVVKQIDAVSNPTDLHGTYDFGLITLKAPYIRSALEPLVKAKRVASYVSLGNGLVQDLIRDIVSDEQVIVGIISWGATNLGPGHIRQTTVAPIVIGESAENNSTDTSLLASILAGAAEVERTIDIEGLIWSKLLLNS
jgi:2-dehydropantoate 2-reductase